MPKFLNFFRLPIFRLPESLKFQNIYISFSGCLFSGCLKSSEFQNF
ncbi:MAG: hypothetical protein J6V99_07395 [Neisseriaceae bacterium]|nr:hypothetical protein [Neisseriaceae bacterium]